MAVATRKDAQRSSLDVNCYQWPAQRVLEIYGYRTLLAVLRSYELRRFVRSAADDAAYPGMAS